MVSNFAVLYPTDPKFSALKDLNPFSTVPKAQEASVILRLGFFRSKWPHLLHKMGFVDSLTQTTVFVNLRGFVFKITSVLSDFDTPFSCCSSRHSDGIISKLKVKIIAVITCFKICWKKEKLVNDCYTVSEHQSHTPSREKRHFLYFNHLSKEFLVQMIPHLKALI